MALAKKCRCGRDGWDACAHPWWVVRRVRGKLTYENVGADKARAVAAHESRMASGPVGDTMGEVGERWYRAKLPRIRSNTAHNYRHALDRVKEAIGHVPVRDVNAATIAEMEAACAAAGLAPGYITNIRVCAMGVLHFAHDANLRGEPPSMRRQRPLGRRSEVRHLEPAEMAAVVAAMRRHGEMVRFGYLTGLRPGELLAVRRADLDGRQLVVARQVNTRTGQIVEHTKTDRGRRRVDVGDEAVAILAAAPDGDRAWPIAYSTLLHYWQDALVRAKVAPAGLHAIRHSNAALRIAAGQDLVYMADQLGHANGAFTLRVYGHLIRRPALDAGVLEDAARQLAEPPSA